jgi:PAS domain S-box-containing protein
MKDLLGDEVQSKGSRVKASEDRFWQVIRTSPVATILRSLDTGRVVDVNERYAQLVGYTREELVGHTVYDFNIWADVADAERILGELERVGTIRDAESRFRRKSGEIREVLICGELVTVDGERMVVGMLIDITERKRMERKLTRSREQLRALTARLQKIREEERIRIARELHDEIGGFLTVLKLDLSSMASQVPSLTAEARRRLDAMGATIVSAIGAVRRICSDLRPSLLDHIGLGAAIEWQLAEFQSKTGIRCALLGGLEDDSRLDPDRATATFRILQEALTNVARHAGAKQVSVRLEADAERLHLEIQDDGRGIDSETVLAPTSLGLLGMQERVFPFGGSVEVRGESGVGTTVEVSVPLGVA